MSKRYGKIPSEIAKLDADDFEFNLLVLGCGLEEEERQLKKAERKSKRGKR